MSEKQKENLKKAREKAMANRKARKEAKQKDEPLPKTRKEQREQKQLEEVAKKVPQTVNITNTITKKDIEDITNSAILKYDEARKERKAIKQKEQQKQKEQHKIQNTIRQATTGYKMGNDGYFGQCF